MSTYRSFSEEQRERFRDHLERLRCDYVHHMVHPGVGPVESEDIEDALEKIKLHTYGLCEECGVEISIAYLEAVPETRYCGPCFVARESELHWRDGHHHTTSRRKAH